jgi:hypothetical protein
VDGKAMVVLLNEIPGQFLFSTGRQGNHRAVQLVAIEIGCASNAQIPRHLPRFISGVFDRQATRVQIEIPQVDGRVRKVACDRSGGLSAAG